ncbi:MAG: hypothetical protein JWL73_1400 [Actinomycetia bacterium]|nr:hypothetical protein [Actinomycetes bacterium]
MIRRLARNLAVAALVGATSVVAIPTAASAHGVGGLQPSNYRTDVQKVTPRDPQVTVKAVDLGNRLELTNDGRTDVTVIGYQKEPYLRVGPDGVFENTKSPAVWLNRATKPSAGALPDRYDASAAPQWKRISTGHTARWHDHRAHWMGTSDPAIVTNSPGSRHVVIPHWSIGLRVGNRSGAISGDVLWVPGPAPWPWFGAAAVLAVALVLVSRTRFWRAALVVALSVLLVAEALHVGGTWGGSTAAGWSKSVQDIYSVAGWVITALALVFLLRRDDPYDATPAVLIAAVFVFLAGGLTDVTELTRSQIPSTLPEWLSRATTTIALGLGFGVLVAAALRLRRPAPPPPDPVVDDRLRLVDT